MAGGKSTFLVAPYVLVIMMQAFFFFLNIYLFRLLQVLGCGMWDLCCGMWDLYLWHVYFLVVACMQDLVP